MKFIDLQNVTLCGFHWNSTNPLLIPQQLIN
uniref:Uncharacterized protein n=1 Tax=Utricularia reniformis TaxID=192314 RepID=A0A1Y0AZ47_9LAMI|nr:hypothetical protein AEK19_MT0174 [Utricularia reniformis]ART30456.1 hypothetical protein AEK19_MT0174 [Utricularia reniformis]